MRPTRVILLVIFHVWNLVMISEALDLVGLLSPRGFPGWLNTAIATKQSFELSVTNPHLPRIEFLLQEGSAWDLGISSLEGWIFASLLLLHTLFTIAGLLALLYRPLRKEKTGTMIHSAFLIWSGCFYLYLGMVGVAYVTQPKPFFTDPLSWLICGSAFLPFLLREMEARPYHSSSSGSSG